MTNQPTNNEWIEKAYKAYKENIPNYINPIDSFKKAIEDNLPQSISREALEKLRDQYKERDKQEVTVEAGDVLKDLDQLLSPKE